ELLSRSLSRSKLKILSPFDNLLIQRKRIQTLFHFDYQIECYVPEAKRQYGYFSLPILWDGQLLARMDCKADRKTAVLHIKHLVLEANLTKTEAFALALSKELKAFMQFNDCTSIQLHKTTPASFKNTFQSVLKDTLS
ncbi:DNA glycosylase AlkZ-like family protein, partial [Ancylomarina sp.]|uniref:DNA glycosylase AlkZ-like family protein n=1 Tax=Ancylomarina sp. TaxID=1970196 RepID=UPI0035626F31